jgi:Asp-tRNA(Asn)/Glu-tRNA(Gln) amidotransferase A subunit family amidase
MVGIMPSGRDERHLCPEDRPYGGAVTAPALADQLDVVVDKIDRTHADLHAFVPEPGRAERVRRLVRELEERWPDPEQRPPLYGLPLAVKDVFRSDGLPTRAGSKVPQDELAGPEAAAVTRLRDAGAIVVGKSETTEFAFFAPGPTRNPHHPDHTPGGSSSGSAAAVTAGLVPLALGTQTIGSIGRPAAYCGCLGFKPTYARVPTDGVIANAPTFDTVGLFAADLRLLATAAGVLCDGWRAPADVRRPVLGVPARATSTRRRLRRAPRSPFRSSRCARRATKCARRRSWTTSRR